MVPGVDLGCTAWKALAFPLALVTEDTRNGDYGDLHSVYSLALIFNYSVLVALLTKAAVRR